MKAGNHAARWTFFACAALVAAVATLSALGLRPSTNWLTSKDPLKPDHSAVDATGEVRSWSTTRDLERAERYATQQFGSLPPKIDGLPGRGAAELSEASAGIAALKRVHEIRRTQGEAAALEAITKVRAPVVPTRSPG